MEGGDFRDGNGEGLSAGAMQRFACATQEALEVVRSGCAGIDFHAVAVATFADLDEGGEEIIHAVAELLDVGVLVRGALVAIDGEALVHDVSVEIMLLAK